MGGKKPPLNVLSLTLVNRAFRSAMYCISFCGRDRTCLYSTDTHYIRGDRSRSIHRSWVAKQPWKLTVLFLYSNTEILQELSDRREWLNLLCSIIQINYNYCNKLRIVLWVLWVWEWLKKSPNILVRPSVIKKLNSVVTSSVQTTQLMLDNNNKPHHHRRQVQKWFNCGLMQVRESQWLTDPTKLSSVGGIVESKGVYWSRGTIKRQHSTIYNFLPAAFLWPGLSISFNRWRRLHLNP